MKLQVLSIIAVVMFLSRATVQAAEDQAKEVKMLQGEWQLDSIEVDGKKKMVDEIQKLSIRLEFKGDEPTFRRSRAEFLPNYSGR